MLRRILARSADYLLRTGAPGVLGALISVFVFGANIVLITGGTAAGTLATGAVVLVVAAGILAILARIVEADRQFRRAEDRLRLYCQALTDRSAELPWRVVSWEDKVYVAKNGDTAEEISVQVIVTKPDFHFVRVMNGSGHLQPKRLRRLVRVETSSIAVSHGPENVSWFITKSWQKNNRLEVLAHCRSQVAVGSVIALRLYYQWPAKCLPLMRGEPDLFKLRFRSGLENLDYTVTMPGDREIECDPLEGPDSARGRIRVAEDAVSRTQSVHLSAQNIQPGMSIGVSLRVKGAVSRRRLLPSWWRT